MKSVFQSLSFVLLSALAFAQEMPSPIVVDAADHESLQAALDALPEEGGMVRIPPGTYDINAPLRLTTPETRITGAGPSTHIRNANVEGEPAFILRPPNLDEDPKAKLWRVQLDNFRVSGNEKSGPGILAENINEIFLHGLSIDHHGGHGIALIDCYEDPRVADSILTYNRDAGLFIDAGHDIVVNGNHFEENQDGVRCVDAFNLCMNGNNLDDHLGNGVVIENTYGSVLSGNMIEECQGIAIILDRDCYGITVSANVIAHHLGGGIDLRDAHGCAVSANTFTLVHEFSLRVGPDSGRIAVTGNSFSNSHIGGAEKREIEHEQKFRIDTATGVKIDGASHILVSGNSFTGIQGEAVVADERGRGNLVTGNIVADWNRSGKGGAKPFELPDANGNSVSGNVVE